MSRGKGQTGERWQVSLACPSPTPALTQGRFTRPMRSPERGSWGRATTPNQHSPSIPQLCSPTASSAPCFDTSLGDLWGQGRSGNKNRKALSRGLCCGPHREPALHRASLPSGSQHSCRGGENCAQGSHLVAQHTCHASMIEIAPEGGFPKHTEAGPTGLAMFSEGCFVR